MGIAFTKEGNCFTAVADPQALAQVADTLSQDAAAGRLSQVCDRWIHTACLCFGLDSDEQTRSGFRYNYSVYQVEYSRNLIFRVGGQMDRVFNTVIDRTRARLDVPTVRTMFGAKRRPGVNGTPDLSPKLAVVIETPRWDLTLFKVHFGLLTLKGYTKGERLLRFEAVTHNTRQLGCGRTLVLRCRSVLRIDRYRRERHGQNDHKQEPEIENGAGPVFHAKVSFHLVDF